MKNLGKFNKIVKKSIDFIPERAEVVEILKSIKSSMIKIEAILVKFQSNDLKPEVQNLISCYLSNMFGKISRKNMDKKQYFIG